ncbi:uncharacterized protein LOC144701998 [Wolffia australiana]
MRDFPSCFGENGVQVADSSSAAGKNGQNLVSCVYHARISGLSCSITVLWSRNLMGQGFSIAIDDAAAQNLCRVDIRPWLFSKRKGSKSADLSGGIAKIDIFWDLSAARFGPGPEPLEGFFVALLCGPEMVLLLGDLAREAYRKTNAATPPSSAVCVSKKEHLFGKKAYSTRAQFSDRGQVHDLVIECETLGLKDPSLEIIIDRKRVMQVKRLGWKFRGNQTILVDGVPVEVLWDVHSWLFGPPMASAVFMFQTSLSPDKLASRSSSAPAVGFSLVLHAWKHD